MVAGQSVIRLINEIHSTNQLFKNKPIIEQILIDHQSISKSVPNVKWLDYIVVSILRSSSSPTSADGKLHVWVCVRVCACVDKRRLN